MSITSRRGRSTYSAEENTEPSRQSTSMLAVVFWRSWHKKGGVLCTARTGRNVHLIRRERRTKDCSKQPAFGVAGTRTVDYCASHALDEIVNVNITCRTEIRGRQPFGVEGTKTAKYCAQHAGWYVHR